MKNIPVRVGWELLLFVFVVMIFSTYQEILKDLGYIFYDTDVNGWQVDFWQYFQNEDKTKKLCLSGSLWFGNFKLTKVEDEN